MKKVQLFLAFLLFCFAAEAQTILSNGTGGGLWNAPSSWIGGVVPDFSNSTEIRIQSGDVISVPSGFSVQVDQCQVRTGGQLVIDAGGVVDVVNGTGNDLILYTGSPNGFLTVSGRLELTQGAAIVNFNGTTSSATTASTVTVNNGGVYRHKYTTSNGTMLGAGWQTGSTAEVVGFTTNTNRPLNLNQSFSNFTWNCPSQSGIIDLRGTLSTVQGNLSILSTGGASVGRLRMFYADNNMTLSVGGNLIISGQSGVWFNGTGTGNSVTIGGGFIINTPVAQTLTRSNAISISCSDLSILDASCVLYLGVNTGSVSNFNVSGNLSVVGAISAGMGSGNLAFTGVSPTVQTISGSGNIGLLNYSVGSGAIVDVGTSSIRGTGSLTVNANAELRVGSLDAAGAIQNSTTAGNIRVPVSLRSYNSQATIRYNGAGTQVMTTGHPVVNTIVQTNTTLGASLTVSSINFAAGTFTASNKQLTVNGNWTVNGGTFAPGTGAVVFAASSSILGSGPFSFNTVNLNNGATLTLPASSISVGANFTVNSGTVVHSNGTVLFNGSATQTFRANGNTFFNVTANKTGGDLNLANSLILRGVLSIQSATTFRTNGLLTLVSTGDKPAAEGTIGALATGASIVGDVTVQRYFSATDNLEKYISSPVSNATVAQIQDDFAVTGDFVGSSFPCTGCANDGPSLKRYVETTSGAFTNGYVQHPPVGGSNTAVLAPGVGYKAYMWNAVSAFVWDVTGPVNQGTINYSVSHNASTPTPVATADGWNLVGNPFPSAIQWNNSSGWTRTNIDPTVWVWDTSGQIWRSYNKDTQTGNLSDGVISLGQAFWVYVPTPSAAALSVREAAKYSTSNGSFYREANQRSTQGIVVKMSKSNSAVEDHAYLVWDDRASDDFDAGLDNPKLQVGEIAFSISLREDGLPLNQLAKSKDSNDAIQLLVTAGPGSYQLAFDRLGNSVDWSRYFLIDATTGLSTRLSTQTLYSFQVGEGGYNNEPRFYLSMEETKGTELELRLFPNPASDRLNVQASSPIRAVEVVAAAGGIIFQQEFAGQQSTCAIELNCAEGVYILRVLTDRGVGTAKFVKK